MSAGPARRPRLGFLGVGWIGRHRMQAMLETGLVEAAAVAEPDDAALAQARPLAPQALVAADLDALLAMDLDGLVIATPSALHAAQAIAGLAAGCAVFCQKPLGRSQAEVRAVVEAARRAGRLLGVDMSYRYTQGMQAIRRVVAEGSLGRVHAVDLVFHNAYGPDKPWFYDRSLSGGGCVMDLGVHLVDLALWTLGYPAVAGIEARLFAAGMPLEASPGAVEDYAEALVDLAGGTVVRLACSWRLHAGQDAVIAARFHGTEGGAAFVNRGGSFYDFAAERYRGTAREVLASPPDDWGGRAAADWARRLASGEGFDPEVDRLVDVAAVLDGMARPRRPV